MQDCCMSERRSAELAWNQLTTGQRHCITLLLSRRKDKVKAGTTCVQASRTRFCGKGQPKQEQEAIEDVLTFQPQNEHMPVPGDLVLRSRNRRCSDVSAYARFWGRVTPATELGQTRSCMNILPCMTCVQLISKKSASYGMCTKHLHHLGGFGRSTTVAVVVRGKCHSPAHSMASSRVTSIDELRDALRDTLPSSTAASLVMADEVVALYGRD